MEKMYSLNMNQQFRHGGRLYVRIPEMLFRLGDVSAVVNCLYVFNKDDVNVDEWVPHRFEAMFLTPETNVEIV